MFYWKHTYKIKNKYLHNNRTNEKYDYDTENVLENLYEDIYNCGRSIDLLRLCESSVGCLFSFYKIAITNRTKTKL